MVNKVNKQFSVCVIEDTSAAQKDIIKYLEERKIFKSIHVCNNYEQALSALLHNEYDLFFLNPDFDKSDGLVLLDKINNKPDVIFLATSRKYEDSALKIAAVDYIIKPLSKKRFNIALDCFLSRH